jgi:hypothetical protein
VHKELQPKKVMEETVELIQAVVLEELEIQVLQLADLELSL